MIEAFFFITVFAFKFNCLHIAYRDRNSIIKSFYLRQSPIQIQKEFRKSTSKNQQ